MSKRFVLALSMIGLLHVNAFADTKADAKADTTAKDKPAATVPKCRALDTKDKTNVFAEAEQKSQLKCLQLLIPELRKKWCTAENKGKKFDYLTDYDHTIGGKKIKGRKESITCKTVAK